MLRYFLLGNPNRPPFFSLPRQRGEAGLAKAEAQAQLEAKHPQRVAIDVAHGVAVYQASRHVHEIQLQLAFHTMHGMCSLVVGMVPALAVAMVGIIAQVIIVDVAHVAQCEPGRVKASLFHGASCELEYYNRNEFLPWRSNAVVCLI